MLLLYGSLHQKTYDFCTVADPVSYTHLMGAQIYVGTGDEMNMITGNFGPESPFTNHVMPPCHPDVCIHEDMDISVGGLCIHALRMPGHTSGSMLYYVMLDKEAVLFSGDMFFADGETGEMCIRDRAVFVEEYPKLLLNIYR